MRRSGIKLVGGGSDDRPQRPSTTAAVRTRAARGGNFFGGRRATSDSVTNRLACGTDAQADVHQGLPAGRTLIGRILAESNLSRLVDANLSSSQRGANFRMDGAPTSK
ncbi:hypothetical protein MBOU_27900 [Mycobacterium bourgelatii]|uniref:Uncharacterized protein n=1 Tax=Mycobacterium bourgelatii TaxID=1273442 RepID=A0A7I9YQ49_MYCBU|nr:hypothetical protein MBOU_27900 [Mycobacterium bourgelatii]